MFREREKQGTVGIHAVGMTAAAFITEDHSKHLQICNTNLKLDLAKQIGLNDRVFTIGLCRESQAS